MAFYHASMRERRSLYELQQLVGWESAEMVRRYAHVAPEHLAGGQYRSDCYEFGCVGKTS